MSKEIWVDAYDRALCSFIDRHGREPHGSEQDAVCRDADERAADAEAHAIDAAMDRMKEQR
jgi:hypothetical protein